MIKYNEEVNTLQAAAGGNYVLPAGFASGAIHALRAGNDLLLFAAGTGTVRIENFFDAEDRPRIVDSAGENLSPELFSAPDSTIGALPAVGVVDDAIGDVTVVRGESGALPLTSNMSLVEGDVISTAGSSSIQIALSDGTILVLDELTHLVFESAGLTGGISAGLDVLQGGILFISGSSVDGETALVFRAPAGAVRVVDSGVVGTASVSAEGASVLLVANPLPGKDVIELATESGSVAIADVNDSAVITLADQPPELLVSGAETLEQILENVAPAAGAFPAGEVVRVVGGFGAPPAEVPLALPGATVPTYTDDTPRVVEVADTTPRDDEPILLDAGAEVEEAMEVAAPIPLGVDDPEFPNLPDGGVLFSGTSADEFFVGGSGDDVLFGGPGADSLAGGPGNDSIVGNPGPDNLDGGIDDDVIFGGAGNDTLIGGGGNNVLDGGTGIDTATFIANAVPVTADLATGTALGGPQTGTNVLSSIENLVGGSAADQLIGDDGPNEFVGGPGNDTIIGGNGEDVAVFTGVFLDHEVTVATDAVIVEDSIPGDGDDGSDSLAGVEVLQFVDRLIFLDGRNNAPIAVDELANTAEDTAVAINVVANDSDFDGDPLSVASVTGAANGTLTIVAAGTINYQPNLDFFGADIFSYTVTDGNGGTATATVMVDVSLANDTPVAVDDGIFPGFENSELTITADTLLANDSDADGDSLSISSVGDAVSGAVGLSPVGNVVFTPNPDFVGEASFSYTVTDGFGGADSVVVLLNFAAVNGAPVVLDDDASTDFGVAVDIDVLDNDDDPDGDALSVTAVGPVGNGMVVINPDNTLTYTPNAGFDGQDNFTYTAADGNGGISVGNVVVSVASAGIVLNGTPGDDTLVGTTGPDSIDGLGGNDSIDGLGGDDSLVGGRGNDELEGGNGSDTLDGGRENDTLIGGAGDDSLIGDRNDDRLEGGDGSDTLDGGRNNDTLIGGTGNDSLIGDRNDDRLGGGDGFDTLDGGLNNDTLIGGVGDDLLIGDRGNDELDGGDGSDTLDGGRNNDTLIGGAGDDSLFGDRNDDLLEGGDGSDTLDGGRNNDTLIGGAGDDSLIGDNNNDLLEGGDGIDTLLGGNNNDTLFGGEGDDQLDGGAGNRPDVLVGGGGADQLQGGGGDDVFGYEAIADGTSTLVNGTPTFLGLLADTILDFDTGDDEIHFLQSEFGALGNIVDGTNFSAIAGEYDGTNGTSSEYLAGNTSFVFDDIGNLYHDTNGAAAGYTLIGNFQGDAPVANDLEIVTAI